MNQDLGHINWYFTVLDLGLCNPDFRLADDRPQRAGAGDGGHVPRPPVPGPDPAQPARRHEQEKRRGRRRLRLLGRQLKRRENSPSPRFRLLSLSTLITTYRRTIGELPSSPWRAPKPLGH